MIKSKLNEYFVEIIMAAFVKLRSPFTVCDQISSSVENICIQLCIKIVSVRLIAHFADTDSFVSLCVPWYLFDVRKTLRYICWWCCESFVFVNITNGTMSTSNSDSDVDNFARIFIDPYMHVGIFVWVWVIEPFATWLQVVCLFEVVCDVSCTHFDEYI